MSGTQALGLGWEESRLRLSPQVKTLLLNAAQDTMTLPLTPPSPAGEILSPIASPLPPAHRGLFSFRTSEGLCLVCPVAVKERWYPGICACTHL